MAARLSWWTNWLTCCQRLRTISSLESGLSMVGCDLASYFFSLVCDIFLPQQTGTFSQVIVGWSYLYSRQTTAFNFIQTFLIPIYQKNQDPIRGLMIISVRSSRPFLSCQMIKKEADISLVPLVRQAWQAGGLAGRDTAGRGK